mgnify:CR=1 FL=1
MHLKKTQFIADITMMVLVKDYLIFKHFKF